MDFDDLVEAAIYQLLNTPCDDDPEEGIDPKVRALIIKAKIDDYVEE